MSDVTAAHAAGQASANYIIPKDTINSGVGDMASANFVLRGSVGDAVATGSSVSAGFIANAGFRYQLDLSVPTMVQLLSVFSRKVHGAAGPFDVPVDLAQLVTGNVSIEPRGIGAGHTLHFRFDGQITVAGNAASSNHLMAPTGIATTAISGNDVIVTLTGIPNAARVKVDLTGVNGSATATAALGFLLGDVNGNRSTSNTDVSAVKARAGQAVVQENFRNDLNASGTVTAADVAAAKAKSGSALP
ncbi:MAG: hypothetical protein JNK75_05465 [Betaproteobacteria bacterium]|nr:hypothetical protein [Betaproteobacteria bacterium]